MESVNGESSTLPLKQRGAVEEIISKRLKTLTKKIVRLPFVQADQRPESDPTTQQPLTQTSKQLSHPYRH